MQLMLDSLGKLLAHPHTSVLLGVGLVAVVACAGLRRVDEAGLKRVLAVCFLWALFLVWAHPPHGMNLRIYWHNAELSLQGEPAYGRTAEPADGSYGSSHRHPRYLDYTGLQHLVYVGSRAVDLSGIDLRLMGLGFQLLWLLEFAAVLQVLRRRQAIPGGDRLGAAVWPAVVLAFHPAFTLYLLVNSWEDKLPVLLLPLLFVLLVERRRLYWAGAVLGASVAMNGVLVFAVPAFLLHVFRERREQTARAGLVLFAVLLLGLAPFLPESLAGWENRLQRMNTDHPFWFTPYHLLPDGFYTAAFNRVLTLGLALVLNLACWRRWIGLGDAVVGSVCLVMLLGPFNVVPRVLPMIVLVATLTPGIRRRDWLVCAALLSLYLLFGAGLKPGSITGLHVIVFHVPIVWALARYVRGRRLQARGTVGIHGCEERAMDELGGFGPREGERGHSLAGEGA